MWLAGHLDALCLFVGTTTRTRLFWKTKRLAGTSPWIRFKFKNFKQINSFQAIAGFVTLISMKDDSERDPVTSARLEMQFSVAGMSSSSSQPWNPTASTSTFGDSLTQSRGHYQSGYLMVRRFIITQRSGYLIWCCSLLHKQMLAHISHN